MKSKTYFSIKIYDEITITGKNPYVVMKYLYDMHSAFYELQDYYFQNNMENLHEKAADQMKMIGKAIDTLKNHLNK